jgi:predicted  nucleic acid-binding Zn-ribbon protein
MPAYFHPHRPVLCYVCGDPLEWVFDPAIRDTCKDCGGKANCLDVAETREAVRRDRIERIREAKREAALIADTSFQ